MKKIIQFKKIINIYTGEELKQVVSNEIKNNITKENVIIKHYEVISNSLKEIFKQKETDIIVREELKGDNGNTLLVDVYMTNDSFNNCNFKEICDLLSKRILNIA